MKTDNIYLAIIGALNKFEGFGDIIATNSIFFNDKNLISQLSKFDNFFSQHFNNYSGTKYDEEKIIQQFFFATNFDNKTYYFAIRANKRFTNFPERSRFYERREYFFFDLKNEYDTIDFALSLPEMKQYAEKQYGTAETPTIKSHKYNPDIQISKAILSVLLNNDTVKIKINDNAQDLILNAISVFPDCYKKYLGFGFNVKDDSFTNSHLHIFSTFDADGAVDIETLKKENNQKWSKCVEFLLSDKNHYNDTEILKSEITRETLYKLLNYHKLHYQVDNDKFLSTKEDLEDLKSKTMSYVFDFVKNDFVEKEEKTYIDKRITEIVNFWDKKEMLEQSDLPNLFDKEDELKILFKNNVFLKIIVDLLKKESLDIQLQWKNKYDEVNKELKIELEPTNNLSKFLLDCKAFKDNYCDKNKKEYENIIKPYIEGSINLDGNWEYAFYECALQTPETEKYDFKITIQADKVVSTEDKTLFDFYTLFEKNINNIENNKTILNDIAKKIIIADVNSIKDIKKFLPENKAFLETYIENIAERIRELYKNKELGQEECIKIFDIRKSIQSTKGESNAKIVQLINTIINRNYYKAEEMRSIIDLEKSNKRYKICSVIFVFIICMLLVLSVYLFANSKKTETLEETNTPIIEQLQEENNILKQQLQNYKIQYEHTESVQNGDSIIN